MPYNVTLAQSHDDVVWDPQLRVRVLRGAVLLNAQSDPEGFTLAAFRLDIAVDPRGRMLQVRPTHIPCGGDNPSPSDRRILNAWRVAYRFTQKNDQLFFRTVTASSNRRPCKAGIPGTSNSRRISLRATRSCPQCRRSCLATSRRHGRTMSAVAQRPQS